MAISVDWALTKVIFVPKADTTLVSAGPPEIRELNVDDFRLTLRDLEDDPDGRPWPKTHTHETESTLSGIVYARKVQIIPPYTVEFEDGQYAVNLIGANHNILDVRVQNQVSLNVSNSAGSTVPAVTEQQAAVLIKSLLNKLVTSQAEGKLIIYDDDDVTRLLEGRIWQDEAETIPYAGDGIEVRERLQSP